MGKASRKQGTGSRIRTPIFTWSRMICISSGSSLPTLSRTAGGVPIFPMSCNNPPRCMISKLSAGRPMACHSLSARLVTRSGQGSERPQIQFVQCVDRDLQLVLLKACGVVLRDAGTKRGEECFLRHGLGEKPENLSLIHSSHGCFDVAVTGQHHTDGIR